jgi:hypothetical protein
MKNDFVEKMALQAAAEALKDGNASVKDAKSFNGPRRHRSPFEIA